MAPTFFALVVCAAGLLAGTAVTMQVQMLFCLFGAAAAVTLPALGGAVITPSVMFLPFVIVRAWWERRRTEYMREVPRAGVWLAVLVIWAVLGTIVLPRLFAGAVDIMTIDRSAAKLGVALIPLRPVSGNITQAGYALSNVGAFLAFRVLIDRPGGLEAFGRGALLLATLNCAAGIIDLAQFHLGLPAVLDYVRTAYAVFQSYEARGTGLMRIQGTFSETSSFSMFTLPLFAFAFSAWRDGVRPNYTGPLALLSFLLLALSTSTTAYVGLTLYLCTLVAIWAYRSYARGAMPLVGMRAVVLGMLLVGASVLLFQTELADRLESYFEITVFEKLESRSGETRSTLNSQAWSNFVDTYGLGVGLGSARASSFALALVSNVGALGTVLFLGFVNSVLRGPRATRRSFAPVREAARHAVLASLAGVVVSHASFDLGVAFYGYAAAASTTPEDR